MGLETLGPALPVLIVLSVLSVASVAVFLARLLALRGMFAGETARAEWLEKAEAGETVAPPTGNGPVSRITARASNLLRRNVPDAALVADLTQAGNAEVAAMARGIRFLDLTGMIAPLLGLLGTVLGMIQSFRSLELAEGSANASILAGGIWQALLTTAVGLVVAIPALAAAAILQARVERGTQEIERLIAQVSLIRTMRE